MSRRGKDDGFRPHPGDPWSPGWTSDEEPAAEEETAAVAEEPALEPGPELETGAREAAVEGAAAEVEETVAAGGIPAAEADDWTEVLGVRAEEPGPPVVPAASGESVPQALLDWAQGQLPLEVAPAVPGSEPEHLPPPWSPEDAEAELAAGAPPEPELVEAEMDHLPPSWAPEDPEAEPPVVRMAEPAAEAEAADVEPAGPGWADVAEDWVPAESSAAAGEKGAEVEVEEWLSFAGGAAAGAAVPAEQPMVDEAVQGVAGAAPAMASRRRFWPFGRRGRFAEEPPGEWPEEEWAAAEGGGEAPGLQPPPWSPETEEEVGSAGSGLLLPEEPEETPVGVAAGEAEEEGWEQPVVEEPAAVAAGDWEPGEEAPPPPPWVDQSDLDRAAPIPIIPARLPENEPVIEPEGAGWSGGSAASPDSWAAEAEPPEGFPAAPPDEEPTEEWEAFPEPGRPAGADEPPSALGAPSGEWGEPVGIEAAGAPATEIPPPEAAGYLTREEVFAGAVTSEHRDLAEEVAAADTAEAHLQALSAPMAGLESGVVGFEDVVYLGGEEEYVERPRSDLPIRVVTGMVLVGILLGAMWVGGEFLAGFVGLLAILGLGELYGTLRRAGYQPLTLFGFLGAIGLLAGAWFYGLVAIPVAAVALTVVCFFYYTFASRRRDPLTNGSITLLGALWVAGPIAFVFPIAVAPDFRVLVLAAAATVIATDVGAFFAGRSWGARPLAPVLSPNKTVEGLAGGVVLGIVVAVVIGYFLEPMTIRIGAGLGLVVAVMAPLGDLAESMVKRSLGVKDMGSILPGHGGILDRIDAYLLVLPAVWVLYETLGLLS